MVNGQQIFQLLALIEREHNSAMQTILDLSEKCSEIRKNWENSPMGSSFQINVIKSAAIGKLKENAHSRILHDLLKVKDERILNSFIKEVAELQNFDFKPEDVDTPDHNRIDLSIRSSKGFLIIENKVNDAEEQRGQLYRYYHYIAKPKVSNESQIKILYLNPYDHTMPSLYSRSKEGKGREEDKGTIRKDLVNVKDYQHDILFWLKNLLKKEEIFKEKNLLKSAVTQYIDYLEDFFELKEIYKTLNIEMEKEILKELRLEGLSNEEKYEILQKKLDEIQTLQKAIIDIKEGIRHSLKDEEINKITQELNDSYLTGSYSFASTTEGPEISFKIIINEIPLNVAVIYYEYNKFYWRIYSDINSLSEEERIKISNLLNINKNLGKASVASNSSKWDIWGDINNQDFSNIKRIIEDLSIQFSKYIIPYNNKIY